MENDFLNNKRLAWFNGNVDALNFYLMLIELSHTWDDLIDKDNECSDDSINKAFAIALLYLPLNPFYASIQKSVLPMWMTVISGYQTANQFEKEKDQHGIEISHSLRYAAGHIVSYAIHVCHNGFPPKDIMSEMWKDIFFDRFDDYRSEHLK